MKIPINQSGAEGKGFEVFFLYILFAFLIIAFLIALIFIMKPVDTDFENPTKINPSFSQIPT